MSTNNIIQSEMKVNNIDVLVLKKNIKNFHLNVLPPDGRVRVSVPKKTNDEAINLFVVTRLPWIRRQIKGFKNQSRQTLRQYITGESHYYKGDRYILNLVEDGSKPRVEIRNKKYIDLFVSKNASREQKEDVFLKWFKLELKKEVEKLVKRWKEKTGVQLSGWSIRQMKTKWGACNIKKRQIWVNSELIKKPVNCLEYIIVHELVHLIERTHSEKFISLMNKYLPQWRSRKDELNELILSYDEWGKE